MATKYNKTLQEHFSNLASENQTLFQKHWSHVLNFFKHLPQDLPFPIGQAKESTHYYKIL